MRQTTDLDADYGHSRRRVRRAELAARLVHHNPEISLRVIQPRTQYEEDRTWCGWLIAPHFFSDCVVSQWDQWRIVTPSRSLLLQSPDYPYEYGQG